MESKYYTWITKQGGKVHRMRETDSNVAPGPEWSLVPNDWGGSPGDELIYFDSAMHKLTEAELVGQGLLADNRGTWYDKENPRESRKIDKCGKGIDKSKFTKEPPIPEEEHQDFDETEGRWVVNAEKKTRAEKTSRLANLKAQTKQFADEAQRPLREKELGIEVEESVKRIKACQAKIDALKPEINRLEEELKSA